MKITVAMNAFKGCLTQSEANSAVCKGLRSVMADAEIETLLIADGGDGSTQALMEIGFGEPLNVCLPDALMRSRSARILVDYKKKRGFVDTASCIGLGTLGTDERNVMSASSYGLGEAMKIMAAQGIEEIVVGLGGSATNDAGVGMMQALGAKIISHTGEEIKNPVGGRDLHRVSNILFDGSELDSIRVFYLYDGEIPFIGERGAVQLYSAQKGASKEDQLLLEKGMENISNVILTSFGKSPANIKGAGAAGGIGGMLACALGATGLSGIDFMLDMQYFDKSSEATDLIITGEGKADLQTLQGKAPYGILCRALRKNIPVIILSGIVEDRDYLKSSGFSEIYDINENSKEGDALEKDTAMRRLSSTAANIVKTIKI